VDAELVPLDIIVTHPTSNTVWTQGQEVIITWEAEDNSTSSVRTNNGYKHLSSSENTFLPSLRSAIPHKISSRYFLSPKKFSPEIVENFSQKSRNARDMNRNWSLRNDNIPVNTGISFQKSSSTKREISYLPEVNIYLYKGDIRLIVIATQFPNSWSCTWTVDSSLVDGTDYKIRVHVWPEANPNMAFIYGESDEFTITGSD
jgi:hypothetical protein